MWFSKQFFWNFLFLAFSFLSIVSLTYAATTIGNDIFTSGTITSQGKAYLTGGVSTPVLNATSSLIDNLTVDQNASLATTTISNIFTTQAPVNFTNGMVSVKAPFKIEKVGSYTLSSSVFKNLFILNNTLFVADGSVSGVKIFNISNPSNVFLEGSTLNGSQAVVAAGDYFYVGEIGGDVIIYKNNNSSSPLAVAGVAITNPYRLDIEGNYLYVLSRGDFYGNYNKLVTIDISNPQAPKIISTYSLTSQLGTDLAYQNGYIFISDLNDGLYIFNVSDPTNPVLVSTYPASIFSFKVRGKYAYVYDANGLDVLDISNPATPTLISNIPEGGTPVLSGNYLYEGGPTGLFIVNIANPFKPVLVQSYNDKEINYIQIALKGNYLYTISQPALNTLFNLSVFSLSGLSSPTANLGNIQSNNLTVTENTNLSQLNISENLTVGKSALFNSDLVAQKDVNILHNLTVGDNISAPNFSLNYATTSAYIALPKVKFIPIATPTSPKIGQCFMDNGAKPQVSCYDGAAWHTLW